MLAVEHNWPTAFKRIISALALIATMYTYGDSHSGELERKTIDVEIKRLSQEGQLRSNSRLPALASALAGPCGAYVAGRNN